MATTSRKKNFLKIVILGDSGVGKTTLLQQYLNGKVNANSKPTIGADFSKKEVVIDDNVVTLQIWDTAGQEKFQSLGYAFYRGADCCCLVYDITQSQTHENLDRWRKGFLDNCGPTNQSTFPFVCLGNKLDAEADRQVTTAQGEEWAQKNFNMIFHETSAMTGQHVEEVFMEMAKAGLKRDQQQLSIPTSSSGVNLKLTAKTDRETRI